jgi:hypothetical protein
MLQDSDHRDADHEPVFARARIGVQARSTRRYCRRMGVAEADVARHEYHAAVNALLTHGYNQLGLDRWWQRPRAALGGLSPQAFLGDDFDPAGEEAQRVRDLAVALVGPGFAI